MFEKMYRWIMAKKLTYTRYLWFIDQTRKGKFPNARTLAEKFEISLPQAQRDIDYIRWAFDAPLKYDADKKGYRIENDAFMLPSVWIRDEELLLLALTKELVPDIDAKKVLRSLFRKVSRCSDSNIHDIEKILTFKGTGTYPLKPGILCCIIEAILKKKKIEIRYAHVFEPGSIPKRVTLSPFHLLYYRGNWYMIAGYDRSIRTYVISRMEEAKMLPERRTAGIPMGKIKKKLTGPYGIYVTDENQPIVPVKLKFSPTIAGFIRRMIFHPRQEIENLADGSIILSFPSTLNPELIGEIMRFGTEVEVLEPNRLRKEVVESLRQTLQKYPI